MKHKYATLFASVFAVGFASAQGLYNIGTEAQVSAPLKWSIGTDFTYDTNVNPGTSPKDSAISANPYVGLSFVNINPQTTWDVYTRLGAIYYFDKPKAAGSKDIYPQIRAGVNLTHRFSERLRLTSRNYIAYELEPNYSYGYATTRQVGAYLNWQTDNALGYRWSERFATYTGFSLTGFTYSDVKNQDRFGGTLYNQFRYQLTPERNVLTLDYRYSKYRASDYAADTSDHHILAGIEHRFSPNTILIGRAGVQFHDTKSGGSSTNPYFDLALNTRPNQNFTLKAFLRYSVESYDTVQYIAPDYYDFGNRQTLRIGLASDYKISKMLSLYGGIDYIPTRYDKGTKKSAGAGPATMDGLTEDLFNFYIGTQLRFTDNLYGSLTYNYTNSSADMAYRNYSRSRVTLGVRYEF